MRARGWLGTPLQLLMRRDQRVGYRLAGKPRETNIGSDREIMRILIADKQDKVRFALRTLLNRQMGWNVIVEAISADEVLGQARLHEPDLALLHWRLCEDMSGLLRRVRSICPDINVLVLSARPEARYDALAAGADAFVCKMDPPQALLAALETLTNGGGNRRRMNSLPAGPDVDEQVTDRSAGRHEPDAWVSDSQRVDRRQ